MNGATNKPIFKTAYWIKKPWWLCWCEIRSQWDPAKITDWNIIDFNKYVKAESNPPNETEEDVAWRTCRLVRSLLIANALDTHMPFPDFLKKAAILTKLGQSESTMRKDQPRWW
jgi:hypothetical protein